MSDRCAGHWPGSAEARYENLYVPFLGHLAELLASDGRSDEAILGFDQIARTNQGLRDVLVVAGSP